jgi:hypothetical protein
MTSQRRTRNLPDWHGYTSLVRAEEFLAAV